jgi:hypothetical protein
LDAPRGPDRNAEDVAKHDAGRPVVHLVLDVGALRVLEPPEPQKPAALLLGPAVGLADVGLCCIDEGALSFVTVIFVFNIK